VRNVKAWANGPGKNRNEIVKALKARNRNHLSETALIESREHHFALSALGLLLAT
jgi:hypothetical protein